MNLQGKVVIVTGGARGIGSAASKLLAQRGAKVVVNYLKNQAAAEAVVSDIRSSGGEAIALRADVRDSHQFTKLVDATLEAFKKIDILVCNAN